MSNKSLGKHRGSPPQRHQSIHWEGPLPPPAILQQYDSVSPGLKDTLIRLVEEEAKHRRDMERGVLANHTRESRARALGSIVSIGTAALALLVPLSASIFFVVHGATVEAVASFVTACGLLYWGKSKKSE